MPETRKDIPTLKARTQGALLREVTEHLATAKVPEPRRNAEWLLVEVITGSRVHLLAHAEREVTPKQIEAIQQLLARRMRREPLQYVVGHTDFYGLRLGVTPDVLIPRPETEGVVEVALQRVQPTEQPRILDVGTGSGCIPLAFKHGRPDATVYACDVSPGALRVARANAEALHLDVTFVEADLLAPDFSERVPTRLDLLISNPPYLAKEEAETLAPEVRRYEPHLALFAGHDPLRFYRALVQQAPALVVPGGWVVFEVHAHHGEAVRRLLVGDGFSGVRLQNDLAGLPRIVYAQVPASQDWP